MNAIPFLRTVEPVRDEDASLLRAYEMTTRAIEAIGDEMGAHYAPRLPLSSRQQREVSKLRAALVHMSEVQAELAGALGWRR